MADLLVATTTGEKDLVKSDTLEGRRGFTFHGPPTDKEVEVDHKSHIILHGSGYTSYSIAVHNWQNRKRTITTRPQRTGCARLRRELSNRRTIDRLVIRKLTTSAIESTFIGT